MERAKIKVNKQDRQGVRTPSDLESKYRFRKNFQDVSGDATEAKTAATDAKKTATKASEAVVGILADFSNLFTGEIEMTGRFICSAYAYIPPGDVEIERIENHINQTVPIPSESVSLFDFNRDGIVDGIDLILANEYKRGVKSFGECPASVATPIIVTVSLIYPDRIISYSGTNMWGRYVEGHVGINFTSVTNPDTEQRLLSLEERLASLEANLGGE